MGSNPTVEWIYRSKSVEGLELKKEEKFIYHILFVGAWLVVHYRDNRANLK